MKNYSYILAVLCSILISTAQTSKQLKHLDSTYQKALKDWHVPGMAVAIVKNDSIIFSKGYGYANIAKGTKVDENTLFAVASNSKAFTSSAIIQLHEQNRLNLHDNVVTHLPYYKLYDNYTTNTMTIEDLLCHRNGLKTFSGDVLWHGSSLKPKEIIAAQQYLKPIAPFRTQFGYSNISYITAGEIIKKVTDTTWADYVSTHFLKPLGMNRTLTSTKQLATSTNYATPYFYENGKHYPIDWVNWDVMAAAGGLISSVKEYSRWLALNINKGTLDGKTYFSKASFNALTTPKISFTVTDNTEGKHFEGAGMGWFLSDLHGCKVISHSGGYDGMISKSAIVPEKGIGIVILSNSINLAPIALINKTLDVLLANTLDGKKWSAIMLKNFKKGDSIRIARDAKNAKLRKKLGKKHIDFKQLTGVYKDKMYGTLTVTEKNKKLYFSMDNTPIFKAELQHWNHNIFTFRFDKKKTSLPEGKLWFDLNKDGAVTKLHIDVPNQDFFFNEFNFIKVNGNKH